MKSYFLFVAFGLAIQRHDNGGHHGSHPKKAEPLLARLRRETGARKIANKS